MRRFWFCRIRLIADSIFGILILPYVTENSSMEPDQSLRNNLNQKRALYGALSTGVNDDPFQMYLGICTCTFEKAIGLAEFQQHFS